MESAQRGAQVAKQRLLRSELRAVSVKRVPAHLGVKELAACMPERVARRYCNRDLTQLLPDVAGRELGRERLASREDVAYHAGVIDRAQDSLVEKVRLTRDFGNARHCLQPGKLGRKRTGRRQTVDSELKTRLKSNVRCRSL